MEMYKFLGLTIIGFILVGCPGKNPNNNGPVQCNSITEDNNSAPDHCSKDKADCEKALSKILADSHQNRCPIPPCTGFSAWVECTPVNQECQLGDGSFGQIFETKEHIRCR
jgi:hypothetical protein